VDRRLQQRPPKIYRGSRRRVRGIRLRGHQSWEIWLLIAWVLFLFLIVVPRLIKNG
jgi:hypothetical protein